MPLGITWSQIFLMFCAMIPLAAFWTVVILNVLYPWWWSITIYHYNHAVYRIRYGRINARIMHSLCPHCAYNLRGNTTGVCSECGREINFLPPRVLPSEENKVRGRFRLR